ncbi:YfbR-like 5'-deoxynucleotidase [Geothrix sp. 21YS21S-2]|uniref:YfbR-like 5'-deoxynucleotidase n=1 Tax=Geothrix sp. 21YS21S-2 TaxID=3068893 RepID=UPI0027B924B9|nr:YfbR-like 5'-deoxynucleotidase [Geothrix sp. 21YS21S-2]
MRILSAQTAMDLQQVKRWHTRRVDHEQTVAAHTASMIALALILAEPYNLSAQDRCDLMQLALVHDAHETVFGDIPYPSRMKIFESKHMDIDQETRMEFWGGVDPYVEVTPQVRDLVEMADSLEAALWSQRYAPNLTAAVVSQAVAKAQQLLDNQGVARVLEILGIRPEVER